MRLQIMKLCTLWLSRLSVKTFALQLWNDWGQGRIQLNDTAIHFRYSEPGKPALLLVHGWPQHSLNWLHLGPILAEQYTVIAPDNRGCGDSQLSFSGNYSAAVGGEDLLALLDFLEISTTHVLAYDKGVGLATSLAFEHPDRIAKLILAEYPLPGFGYTTTVSSSDLSAHWHLAFFAVPDAAEFFVRGRERDMLAWYFWHASYVGNSAFKNELIDQYAMSISKPGFLRSGFQYFASVFEDEVYFKRKVGQGQLHMPVLVMGGESSMGPMLVEAFEAVASDFSTHVIPKAGHWLIDENTLAVAQSTLDFLGNDSDVPITNLSRIA